MYNKDSSINLSGINCKSLTNIRIVRNVSIYP